MKSTDNITLNRLLTNIARQGASDLHLTIGSPPVMRKDGQLMQLQNEEIVTTNFLERIMQDVLQEQDQLSLQKKNEVLFTKTFSKVLRFRVHIYKQKGYYSLAFRYIPLNSKKISDLGLPPYLQKSARLKQGLIIIAGVYDSGKSTSLAAILNTLNELGPPRYINTLESPIEHLFANNKCIIEQREVGRDVASYSHGLSLALEGDIDMVVLDKLTGARPAKKMLEVLEAGRSVILTVEASSVANALNQIFSFFQRSESIWARQTLAMHLICILGQKLVFKIGGGRILVYEFLVNSGIVSSFIAAGHLERIENVLKNAKEFDMVSLENGLSQLVQQGKIKLEQALMEANDKEYLKSLLR